MQQQHGSGKTAVLVERIIHKIVEEKIDIDELLVVTFTNAAASETRQRILDAIYLYLEEHPEDKRMQKQILLLSKSHICTIHSFCLDVIKNYFYEIGISPNIRIGDQTEVELLKQEVLEELFYEKYENEDKEFIKLVETYSDYKGDEPLKEILLKIVRTICSNPFPKEWLEQMVEEFKPNNTKKDFIETKCGQVLKKEIQEQIIACKLELKAIKNRLAKFPELDKFENTINYDIEEFENMQKCITTWDEIYNLANQFKWQTWPRDNKIVVEEKEKAKQKRDQVKKNWNKVLKSILLYNSEEAKQDQIFLYPILEALKNLIFEFEEKFAKKKQEKNMMDFSDIEHFALKILVKEDDKKNKVPTKVALEYQNKFKEIAIDEYQDSNLIQEYILNIISNQKNIFMVGDVKQSIYKFRQAKPELFIEKYERYKLEEEKSTEDSLKIQLFKNFRSRQNILDFTNQIFEQIMTKELGDINYNKEEYLNLGANYPENEKSKFKTELHIIDSNMDKEESTQLDDIEQVEDIVLEARFVANKIKEVISYGNYEVYDKKQGYRKLQYRDIVILLRATSNLASIYEKELNELDIPVFSDVTNSYLETIEIQTILSLLKVIDNPMQDIPLVSVLRSSIVGIEDDELITIKILGETKGKNQYFYQTFLNAIQEEKIDNSLKEKMSRFLQSLDNWRKETKYMALDELIWKIYLDTGYYHYVGLMPNGLIKQANLKMLYEKAGEYEKISFKGLFQFITFMEQVQTSSGDMESAKLIGENEDVVRIMSIHKSKGLEFPVVILTSTGKKFNLRDLTKPILLHQELGIGPKLIDSEKKIEYPTLQKIAIANKIKQETLSEEMRILYVALTRAKEKLIIVGKQKNFQKELEKKQEILQTYNNSKIMPNVLKQYNSYLDWIELVYLNNKQEMENNFQLFTYQKEEYVKSIKKKEEQIEKDFSKESKNYKISKDLQKELVWEYENIFASKIPTKTSVSKIKQQNYIDEELLDFSKLCKMTHNTIEGKIPEFLKEQKEITSSRKGSLIHLCLEQLEFKEEYNEKKIENFIEMLVQNKYILPKEAEVIDKKLLLDFTKTDLFKDLKNAKRVYKEKPFYINIKAEEIYKKETKETILVQGIIDLYYINKENNIILVDYKTDFVKDENELIKKYKKQLEIYKKALEESLEKSVYKVLIYSTHLQRTVEL